MARDGWQGSVPTLGVQPACNVLPQEYAASTAAVMRGKRLLSTSTVRAGCWPDLLRLPECLHTKAELSTGMPLILISYPHLQGSYESKVLLCLRIFKHGCECILACLAQDIVSY